jgi:hypothetical protein
MLVKFQTTDPARAKKAVVIGYSGTAEVLGYDPETGLLALAVPKQHIWQGIHNRGSWSPGMTMVVRLVGLHRYVNGVSHDTYDAETAMEWITNKSKRGQ